MLRHEGQSGRLAMRRSWRRASLAIFGRNMFAIMPTQEQPEARECSLGEHGGRDEECVVARLRAAADTEVRTVYPQQMTDRARNGVQRLVGNQMRRDAPRAVVGEALNAAGRPAAAQEVRR